MACPRNGSSAATVSRGFGTGSRGISASSPASPGGGFHATLALSRARPGVTAIFAGNDTIVLGALAYLGLAVPGDVSVVGFDDLPFAGFVAPPLTTVRIDATHQGRCAAEVLLLRLKGKAVPESRQSFELVFVPRGSSGPARTSTR
ncbi:MAG: substrate-binding domain-containing protein [Amaricoccus sp.]|uniref:substrate-binding domain-containing protein n=1 Tax=Amaricoccus sp. TaxID=1872485 RepID=UPI0039E6C0B6